MGFLDPRWAVRQNLDQTSRNYADLAFYWLSATGTVRVQKYSAVTGLSVAEDSFRKILPYEDDPVMWSLLSREQVEVLLFSVPGLEEGLDEGFHKVFNRTRVKEKWVIVKTPSNGFLIFWKEPYWETVLVQTIEKNGKISLSYPSGYKSLDLVSEHYASLPEFQTIKPEHHVELLHILDPLLERLDESFWDTALSRKVETEPVEDTRIPPREPIWDL